MKKYFLIFTLALGAHFASAKAAENTAEPETSNLFGSWRFSHVIKAINPLLPTAYLQFLNISAPRQIVIENNFLKMEEELELWKMEQNWLFKMG